MTAHPCLLEARQCRGTLHFVRDGIPMRRPLGWRLGMTKKIRLGVTKNRARGDKKGLGETKRGLGVIWEKGVARHNWHKI